MPHPESEHGLRVQLATALRERDEARARERGQMVAVLHTIGGTVEGYPTGAHNYLQRLRALVAAEKAFADAGPMVESAKYMVEKARDCERAQEALAAARLKLEESDARCAMLDGHFSDAVRVAQEAKADLAAARRECDLKRGGLRSAHEYCLYMFSREWLTDPRNRNIFAAHIFAILDAALSAPASAAGEEGT